MGKKKKKRDKKKQKKYNKSQFADIICQNCGVCKFIEPTFCYEAYKSNPKVFMDSCYMSLLKLNLYMKNTGFLFSAKKTDGNIELMRFQEVFCYSGICGPNKQYSCLELVECFNEFRKQIDGEGTGKSFSGKKDKKRKKRERKRQETVFVAYPTFFSSDDEKFKAKIEGILANGD